MSTAVQTLLAIVLLAAAALKLRDRERSAQALATYWIAPARTRMAALVLIVAAELTVGVAGVEL